MVQSRVVGGLRYYRPGQPIVYLMRLYNAVPNDRAETDAQLQIELWQDDQRLSLIAWQPAKDRLIANDARSLIVGGTLNASNLQPGLYELRVSVKNAKQKRPVERVAAFGVE
jgi:hypothetical protein